jgi:hypothetical protein
MAEQEKRSLHDIAAARPPYATAVGRQMAPERHPDNGSDPQVTGP